MFLPKNENLKTANLKGFIGRKMVKNVIGGGKLSLKENKNEIYRLKQYALKYMALVCFCLKKPSSLMLE